MKKLQIDFSKLPQEAPEYDLTELLEAGCHFGHKKEKWNPKMDEFIYMEKNGVHIFDLAKTASQLKNAYNYLYWLGKNGKSVVIVGTKRQAKDIVEATAKDAGMYYIASRWLGGLLTNWNQVRKSISRMNELEDGLKNKKFVGYTKYEQVQFEKELARLSRFFEGIRKLESKPDAIIVIDPVREKNAIKEAKDTEVTVLALADSNADPDQVDILVPANDDAVKSIQYIVSQFAAGYKAGKNA
ncbi:MAG: 30S ribosomal protein S2 [Microgenomates group bacterium]